MEMSRLFYKTELSIDNIHNLTGIAKSKIRFWEKNFAEYLKPNRTEGGQRRYTAADLEKIVRINHLLNQEKYTIEGAKQRLGL
jgi:DNA-binding transcriptional MerR regulator